MHHLRARCRQCEGANAGIAKQVHGDGIGYPCQLSAHPPPHRVHIREKAEVAEWRARCGKVHLIIPCERPSIHGNGFVVIPTSAAIIVGSGNEFGICRPFVERRRPHRLRFWPDEAAVTVGFIFPPIA